MKIIKHSRALLAVLILSFTWTLKAQNQISDAIPAMLRGRGCVKACFLGIEPDITSAEEVEAILEANNLEYEKTVVPNMEGYTYST